MRVEIFVVRAIILVKREVRGRFTPSGVRTKQFSFALSYFWWDVGAVSRPKPDLNAAFSRSQHNVISATVKVKFLAKGGTFGELDATSLVVVDRSIAVVADGSSAASFSFRRKKEAKEI
jgi:hypothetical protein